MSHVLMMASYGLEIVECGGAIARALATGDTVSAAVLMCREDSKAGVTVAQSWVRGYGRGSRRCLLRCAAVSGRSTTTAILRSRVDQEQPRRVRAWPLTKPAMPADVTGIDELRGPGGR